MSEYPIYIDSPVDVQKLPFDILQSFRYKWQLTHRPIDFAYGGLPPFADKIGFIVVRLKHYIHKIDVDKFENLFETYPAGSMRQLKILGNEELNREPKYKNSLVYINENGWSIDCPDEFIDNYLHECKMTNNIKIKEKFIRLLNGADASELESASINSLFSNENHFLKIRNAIKHEMSGNNELFVISHKIFADARSEETLRVTDDEFDAMICAITGLLNNSKLSGEELRKKIKDRITDKMKGSFQDADSNSYDPPERYVLINDLSEIKNMKFIIKRSKRNTR